MKKEQKKHFSIKRNQVLYIICAIVFCVSLLVNWVSRDISTVKEANDELNSVSETVEVLQKEPDDVLTLSDITYQMLPAYKEDAFVYVNDNQPLFTEQEIAYYETNQLTYGKDGFGRPTGICAIVSENTLSNEERGDISDIYPPGWEQEKYDFLSDGYIYNRCHLLAHCLGGTDTADNLITGTRYLNIEGMWQIEETVLNFVRDGYGRVLYRVTPIYNGSELVARGVLMEAYSLDNKDLRICVYCYNVQPGIMIQYKTGENYPQDTM